MHTFSQGCLPRLLYATIQTAGPAVNRTIHRHEGCTELLYVFAGEGVYTAGGHSYPIGAGDVLLYNQGDLHEVISSSSREICDYCFGIAGLTFEGLPTGHLCAAGEAFVRPAGGRNAELASLSRLLYQTTEENTPISREIAGHLLPALILLAAGLPADERSQTQDKNIVLAHRMRQYIGQHFQNPLTLEEIGAVFGISPYHAAHIFKEVVGVSPIQYIIRCRIGEAQNLLIASDYSATQIAAMVGYASVHHFNAIFTKIVGLPPIRYRKRYLENMQGKRTQ